MYPFNVRVYGLLINDRNEILISDEQEYGMQFAKFPGGGLEHGAAAGRAIARFLGRPVERATVTEYPDSYGRPFLLLARVPLVELVSVQERVVTPRFEP